MAANNSFRTASESSKACNDALRSPAVFKGSAGRASGFAPLRRLYQRIWDMGFEAVRWLGRYLLLGAAIVVPVWLIMRLLRASKGR